MKKNLLNNKFWLRVGMIVAIMTTALAGTAWADDEVYSTCLFGTDYNSQTIGSYTATWTASNEDFTWTIVNGNNNNNGWDYIKFGRKNVASVGEIVTSAVYSVAITKVDLTIDKLTASSINSIKLYTSTDNSTWTEAGTFSKATGTQTVNLASPTTNLYYKIEFDCAAGSANGLIQVSKVEYYYNTGGAVTPSITATDLNISYDSTEGEIEYTVNNPVTGGVLTADTEADWLVVGEVEDLVPFECSVNPGAERTAIITLTYSYGDDSVTKDVIITQGANPNGPGSAANPYTVAQARAAIDAGTGLAGVYATGIVSQVDSYNSSYNSITYWISDDGTTTDQLEVYSGKGLNNTNFSSVNDVVVGATVVVYGTLKKYGDTYEFDKNNYLTSYTAPAVSVEAPTFSPIAGTYAEAQSVTISTTTEGATIYYTTDGTEPVAGSNNYNTGSVVSVSETTTIKAIAVKGSDESSVATATYFICSAENPYTVTDALAFPEYPANNVYVTGIVSTAPTQAPTSSGQLTYYISVDGEATNQLQVYKGKGLEQAAFTAQNDIQVGDIVTIFGNVKIYNGTKEFDTGNYLVSFERPQTSEPAIVAEDATIAYDVTYYELMYSIENPVEGTELTATTDATWITSLTPSTKSFDRVMIECEANDGTEARTATIVLTYGDVTKEVTLTQEAYVVDYAELPFSFTGGKADIEETVGLTQSGLGNDYNATTKLKFDSTGDYVVLKFNERPGKLTYSLRYNGFTEGTFSVQGSVDGETYTDLKTHTPNASSSNVLIDDAVNTIAEDVRYIRWIFTEKGTGNIGLGNIALAKYSEAVDNYTLAVADAENVVIIATYGEELLMNGESAEVAEGTEVTVALSIDEGYEFESLTITGEEEGQSVTPSPGEEEGVFTFTMPGYNVTVNATVVEHVETVMASYVLATSITPGKRYVIASGTEGDVQVMAEQRANNRGAVSAEIVDGMLFVPEEYEFVINGNDEDGYTIFDEDYVVDDVVVGGYLYAAGGTRNNYLKTEAELDDENNGIWTISIDDNGVATIKSTGSAARNWMRYNSGSSLFSCYASSQQDIYLFEKMEEVPIVQTVTVTSAGYATMVADTHLEIPADVPVEVYAVQVNGNYATLIPVTGGIPFAAAVIVKASAGEYSFPMADDIINDLETNDLVAASQDVVADGTQYILAVGEYGIGFYKVTEGTTIAAGKAYLVVPSGVKPFYGFYEDNATSIQTIDNGQQTTDVIFNVAGQRLQKVQRGINIVGGKKILR